MKLNDIINEMTLHQLPTLVEVLSRTLKKYNLNFVPLPHSVVRMVVDPSRSDIEALDIYNSINKFLQTNSREFEKYKKNRKEYVGLIQNPNTNLNIVISIDFHERKEFHNFKIVTVIVKKDFGSDNHKQEKIILR